MTSIAYTDSPALPPQVLAGDQGHADHRTQAANTEAETFIPVRSGGAGAAQQPRPIGRWSRRDALMLLGVGCSSIATTLLIFGRLTSLSGRFGFVIVGFLVFLATYAVLTSITERRPTVVDKVMTVLLAAATAVAFFALTTVVVFTVAKGWSALRHLNFFTEDLSETLPNDPVEVGGILHAIVGTLIMMLLALIITVPLGLSCAVFLNESRSRMATFVRTVVTAMTALPSVLAGLFIFALFILILGFERSGLAASVATSIMMLPIIIRSADVVLRLVPGGLREASAALGAPVWRTVWHVVLPTARSGLTTAVILGVARGVGETAPVLLTAGYATSLNLNPLKDPMVSLPLAAFNLAKSPQPTQIARGFATAAVLMILVLILFAFARFLGGRPAGRLSNGQRRRSAARSAEDLQRFEGRHVDQGHDGQGQGHDDERDHPDAAEVQTR